MSIKILGGHAKGLDLDGPKSLSIRPTSVMLKRRLFDSIQDFQNKIFIDLCAGTGSIGIEALSRGAELVKCIDNSSQAIKLLKQNKNKLQKYEVDTGKLEIVKADAISWLESNLPFKDSPYETIIFFDPPYEDLESYQKVFQLITEKKTQAKLIFEACGQKTMRLNEFETKYPGSVKSFKQGTSFFIIYDFE